LVASHVAATKNDKNEIELTEILIQLKPITDIIENSEPRSVSELQIKLIKDEDPFRQCTICLQPFELDNGKFKIEIIEKEFIKYHKIHESKFHKKCIQEWMKDKNSCPICRKMLKEPVSNRLQKMIKSMSNTGFLIFMYTLIDMWFTGGKCRYMCETVVLDNILPEYFDFSYFMPDKCHVTCKLVRFFTVSVFLTIFIVWRRL